MKHRLEFILLILVLVGGCNNSNKSNITSLEVKYSDGVYNHYIDPEESINITSEQLENLKFIPLEATNSSLIGNIGKVEKDSTTGYWFILEANNPNKMFIFDEDGNFVNDIEHQGNGPGEYTVISDFYISDGEWIEILDGNTHRLIRYDLKTNTFISEKELPFHAFRYSYLDNGNYVFYKNVQANSFEDEKYFNKILVIDSTMNIIQKAFPFQIEKGTNISISNPSGLNKTEKGVTFNDFNADTVYVINSETIQPLHNIDFGKYSVPEPEGIDFSSSQEKLNYYMKNKEAIAGANQLVSSPKFFSFIFLYGGDIFFYVHDKNQDKSYIIDEIKFGNKEAFFPPPIERVNSRFVSIYTESLLRKKIKMDDLEKGSDIYNAILEGKNSQNPVLVTYELNLQ